MKKLQKATLRIFLSCMVLTAILMLIIVWFFASPNADKDAFPVMRYVFTFFIVGLASFLTWFTTTVLEIKNRLTENKN
jgi:O-antigen/teichoic acid export membrane protein